MYCLQGVLVKDTREQHIDNKQTNKEHTSNNNTSRRAHKTPIEQKGHSTHALVGESNQGSYPRSPMGLGHSYFLESTLVQLGILLVSLRQLKLQLEHHCCGWSLDSKTASASKGCSVTCFFTWRPPWCHKLESWDWTLPSRYWLHRSHLGSLSSLYKLWIRTR